MDGGPTRQSGVVRAAEAPLVSKLSGRPCVYWDVRQGLDAVPIEAGRQNFWLETEGGKILVLGEHLEVDARGERRRELLRVADADIHALSERLREVKALLRQAQGSAGEKLRKERERLALTATFLHATRAHAKGKVHLRGSFRDQERWIREHASDVTTGPGTATATMAVDVWEVVLEEGQKVSVEGACALESALPELASSDGYRARPTARVFRGTKDSPLVVTGIGAIAPMEPGHTPAPESHVARARVSMARVRTALVLAALVAIVVFALLAYAGNR